MNLLITEGEKRLAAESAAALVEPGTRVGLGTGTTVAYLIPALARRRALVGVRYVASSPATERLAREAGLEVEPFDRIARLDLVIDGADQLTRAGWLNKGRGGAHTREKILASAGARFIVIADASKLVAAIREPVPLELLSFGLRSTLRLLGSATLREAPPTPDGGVLADYRGAVEDPAKLAAWLEGIPGVIGHGLFPPPLATEAVIAGSSDSVERLVFHKLPP